MLPFAFLSVAFVLPAVGTPAALVALCVRVCASVCVQDTCGLMCPFAHFTYWGKLAKKKKHTDKSTGGEKEQK